MRRPVGARALALSLIGAAVAASGCGTVDSLAWHSARGAIHGGYDTLVDPNDRVHRALADDNSPVRQDLRRFLRQSIADALDGLEEAQLQQRTERLLHALLPVVERQGQPVLTGLIGDARAPLAALVDAIVADVVAAVRAQLRAFQWHELDGPVHAVAGVLSAEARRQAQSALGDLQEGFEAQRPALRKVAREATEEIVAGVGDALKGGRLEPLAATVGRQIADGIEDDLRKALAQHEALWRELAIAAAVVLALVAAAALVLWRRHRTLTKALTIVAETINGHDRAPELKSTIQAAARKNEVQGELSDFLKSRGL